MFAAGLKALVPGNGSVKDIHEKRLCSLPFQLLEPPTRKSIWPPNSANREAVNVAARREGYFLYL